MYQWQQFLVHSCPKVCRLSVLSILHLSIFFFTNDTSVLKILLRLQDFCTYWPAAEWLNVFWSRGWLTCRVRQHRVGRFPGAVGGYRTSAAVSVTRRVQRGADVQVQLLSLAHRLAFDIRVWATTKVKDQGEVSPSPKTEQSQVGTILQNRTLASSRLALQHNWKRKKGRFWLQFGHQLQTGHQQKPKVHGQGIPDNCVSTNNELGFGVPLMVCDVVVGLQPNPLLTFGQEAIVAGFALSKLHYWKKKSKMSEERTAK